MGLLSSEPVERLAVLDHLLSLGALGLNEAVVSAGGREGAPIASSPSAELVGCLGDVAECDEVRAVAIKAALVLSMIVFPQSSGATSKPPQALAAAGSTLSHARALFTSDGADGDDPVPGPTAPPSSRALVLRAMGHMINWVDPAGAQAEAMDVLIGAVLGREPSPGTVPLQGSALRALSLLRVTRRNRSRVLSLAPSVERLMTGENKQPLHPIVTEELSRFWSVWYPVPWQGLVRSEARPKSLRGRPALLLAALRSAEARKDFSALTEDPNDPWSLGGGAPVRSSSSVTISQEAAGRDPSTVLEISFEGAAADPGASAGAAVESRALSVRSSRSPSVSLLLPAGGADAGPAEGEREDDTAAAAADLVLHCPSIGVFFDSSDCARTVRLSNSHASLPRSFRLQVCPPTHFTASPVFGTLGPRASVAVLVRFLPHVSSRDLESSRIEGFIRVRTPRGFPGPRASITGFNTPLIRVLTSAVDFGFCRAGDVHTLYVPVENVGLIACACATWVRDSTVFSVAHANFVVAAGATNMVRVSFSAPPSSADDVGFEGTLTVVGMFGEVVEVPLSGRSGSPLVVYDFRLDFGPCPVVGEPHTRNLLLTNRDKSTALSVIFEVSSSASLTVQSAIVEPGSSLHHPVTLAPTVEGHFHETVTVFAPSMRPAVVDIRAFVGPLVRLAAGAEEGDRKPKPIFFPCTTPGVPAYLTLPLLNTSSFSVTYRLSSLIGSAFVAVVTDSAAAPAEQAFDMVVLSRTREVKGATPATLGSLLTLGPYGQAFVHIRARSPEVGLHAATMRITTARPYSFVNQAYRLILPGLPRGLGGSITPALSSYPSRTSLTAASSMAAGVSLMSADEIDLREASSSGELVRLLQDLVGAEPDYSQPAPLAGSLSFAARRQIDARHSAALGRQVPGRPRVVCLDSSSHGVSYRSSSSLDRGMTSVTIVNMSPTPALYTIALSCPFVLSGSSSSGMLESGASKLVQIACRDVVGMRGLNVGFFTVFDEAGDFSSVTIRGSTTDRLIVHAAQGEEISFPHCVPNSKSSRTLTLENGTGAALQWAATFDRGRGAAFKISEASSTLAPWERRSVTLFFESPVQGRFSDTLSFSYLLDPAGARPAPPTADSSSATSAAPAAASVSAGSPLVQVFRSPLSCSVGDPELAVEPAHLFFGSVPVGQKKTLVLTVTNDSSQASGLLALWKEPFSADPPHLYLRPLETGYIRVTCAPTTGGFSTGYLSLSLGKSRRIVSLVVRSGHHSLGSNLGAAVPAVNLTAHPEHESQVIDLGLTATERYLERPFVLVNRGTLDLALVDLQTSDSLARWEYVPQLSIDPDRVAGKGILGLTADEHEVDWDEYLYLVEVEERNAILKGGRAFQGGERGGALAGDAALMAAGGDTVGVGVGPPIPHAELLSKVFKPALWFPISIRPGCTVPLKLKAGSAAVGLQWCTISVWSPPDHEIPFSWRYATNASKTAAAASAALMMMAEGNGDDPSAPPRGSGAAGNALADASDADAYFRERSEESFRFYIRLQVQPPLALAGNTLNFAIVEVGTTVTLALSFTNVGSIPISWSIGPVSVDSVKPLPAAHADPHGGGGKRQASAARRIKREDSIVLSSALMQESFTVTPREGTLLPSRTEHLSVTFEAHAPQAIIEASAVLLQPSLGDTRLFFRGVGASVAMSVDPPVTLNFGTVKVGKHKTLTLVLTNSGLIPARYEMACDSSHFFSVEPAFGAVGARSSASVLVRFDAPGIYAYSDVCRIRWSGGRSSGATAVNVEGVGGESELHVGTGLVDFGVALLGHTNRMPLVVSNKGSAELIAQVRPLLSYPTLSLIPEEVFLVAPGASRVVSVLFRPTHMSSLSADLMVVSLDNPKEMHHVTVVAEVGVPELEVEPRGIISPAHFGVVPTRSSRSISFTLRNTGTYALPFTTALLRKAARNEDSSAEGLTKDRVEVVQVRARRRAVVAGDSAPALSSRGAGGSSAGPGLGNSPLGSAGPAAASQPAAPDTLFMKPSELSALAEWTPEVLSVEPAGGVVGIRSAVRITITFSPKEPFEELETYIVIKNDYKNVYGLIKGVGGEPLLLLEDSTLVVDFGLCRLNHEFTHSVRLFNTGNLDGFVWMTEPPPRYFTDLASASAPTSLAVSAGSSLRTMSWDTTEEEPMEPAALRRSADALAARLAEAGIMLSSYSGVIKPGSSFNFEVRFTPSRRHPVEIPIAVRTDRRVDVILVRGRGGIVRLNLYDLLGTKLQDGAVDFGLRPTHRAHHITLHLRNEGHFKTSFAISPHIPADFSVVPMSGTVAVGDIRPLYITFSPRGPGRSSMSLVVLWEGPRLCAEVKGLGGEGILATAFLEEADKQLGGIDFLLTATHISSEKVFHLRNDGTIPFTVTVSSNVPSFTIGVAGPPFVNPDYDMTDAMLMGIRPDGTFDTPGGAAPPLSSPLSALISPPSSLLAPAESAREPIRPNFIAETPRGDGSAANPSSSLQPSQPALLGRKVSSINLNSLTEEQSALLALLLTGSQRAPSTASSAQVPAVAGADGKGGDGSKVGGGEAGGLSLSFTAEIPPLHILPVRVQLLAGQETVYTGDLRVVSPYGSPVIPMHGVGGNVKIGHIGSLDFGEVAVCNVYTRTITLINSGSIPCRVNLFWIGIRFGSDHQLAPSRQPSQGSLLTLSSESTDRLAASTPARKRLPPDAAMGSSSAQRVQRAGATYFRAGGGWDIRLPGLGGAGMWKRAMVLVKRFLALRKTQRGTQLSNARWSRLKKVIRGSESDDTAGGGSPAIALAASGKKGAAKTGGFGEVLSKMREIEKIARAEKEEAGGSGPGAAPPLAASDAGKVAEDDDDSGDDAASSIGALVTLGARSAINMKNIARGAGDAPLKEKDYTLRREREKLFRSVAISNAADSSFGAQPPHLRVSPHEVTVPRRGKVDVIVSFCAFRAERISASLVVRGAQSGMVPYDIPFTATPRRVLVVVDDHTTLNFGRQPIGESEIIERVFTNVGELPVKFKISTQNSGVTILPRLGTLEPNQSVAVKVAFRPMNSSLQCHKVVFECDSGPSVNLDFYGSGGVAKLVLNNFECHDFGRCMIDRETTQYLRIGNAGTAYLHILAFSLEESSVFTRGEGWPMGRTSIKPGHFFELPISFNPPNDQLLMGRLSIITSLESFSLKLQGAGRRSTLVASRQIVNFDGCIVGNTYYETITFTNLGEVLFPIRLVLVNRGAEKAILANIKGKSKKKSRKSSSRGDRARGDAAGGGSSAANAASRRARKGERGRGGAKDQSSPRRSSSPSPGSSSSSPSSSSSSSGSGDERLAKLRGKGTTTTGTGRAAVTTDVEFRDLTFPTDSYTIGPFEKLKLGLVYTPSSEVENRREVIRLVSPYVQQDIEIYFSAATAVLLVGTEALDFGVVEAGRRSAPMSLKLSNVGNWLLQFEIQNPQPQVVGLQPSSGAIAGGDLTEVLVTLDCTGLRSDSDVTADLQVATNTSKPPSFVSISAKVRSAVLETAAKVDFGACMIGKSKQEPLILTNTGGYPLTFTVEARFPVKVVSGGAGATVEPGGSATVVLQWVPAGGYDLRSALVIRSNSAGDPALSIPVRGVATAPEFALSTVFLDFGVCSVGTGYTYTPGSGTERPGLEVQNTGAIPITWNAASVPDGFSCTPTTGVLLPGQAQSVAVVFTPNHLGKASGTIMFEAEGRFREVGVVGVGGRYLVLAPDSLVLGVCPCDSWVTRDITLINDGSVKAVISVEADGGITGGSGVEVVVSPSATIHVAPRARKRVKLTVRCTKDSPFSTSLRLVSREETKVIMISGTGTRIVLSDEARALLAAEVLPSQTLIEPQLDTVDQAFAKLWKLGSHLDSLTDDRANINIILNPKVVSVDPVAKLLIPPFRF